VEIAAAMSAMALRRVMIMALSFAAIMPERGFPGEAKSRELDRP
jgi:hypothetical protein